MEGPNNEIIRMLFEAFDRFGKLNWCCSPVPGLRRSELFLLIRIYKVMEEGKSIVKVTDLSKMLDVAPPTVTQLLNKLEENGYIERKHDKEDRRAVIVELTDKSLEVIAFASSKFELYFEGLVNQLGKEKAAELADLLNQVLTYFEKQD